MNYKMILLFLIIFILSSSTFALENVVIKSYTQVVTLSERNSFNEVDIILDSKQKAYELNLTLIPRVDNVRLFIDKKEKTCDLQEEKGFSILHCSFPEGILGKHFLQLTYDTNYPIFDINDQIFYKSNYLLISPSASFDYILKLPVGYIIPEEKDISFFINPTPKSIYSDGQRIILLWQEKNVETFEVSVLMDPVNVSLNRILNIVGLILFILLMVAALSIFYLRKIKKKEITYPALKQQEKTIVDLLKKAKDNVMWQKQISVQSKLSKVKVSRILRDLEERGVVRKEPWGNTNKIHLIIGEDSEEKLNKRD